MTKPLVAQGGYSEVELLGVVRQASET
jgi:hypothetical protein